VLYLRSYAPFWLVKEVYRILVGKFHPDVGGDANLFIEVRRAFELIKSNTKKE
jgi:curved DNA-binding protein CbpA